MKLFSHISVIILLFAVPSTLGRLSKILKRYEPDVASHFQASGRDEYLKLDSTGMFSDTSDPLSSFNFNIPTESALKLSNSSEGHSTSSTVPVNESRPGIRVPFITKTGVENKSEANIFAKGFNNDGTKPVNKIDSDFGEKEAEKTDIKTTEKNNKVKTLIAKKILFQAKPVVPANELDDTETDVIYYIE